MIQIIIIVVLWSALNPFLLYLDSFTPVKTMVVLNCSLVSICVAVYLSVTVFVLVYYVLFALFISILQSLLQFSLPPQLSAVPCLCPLVHTRLILAWCPTQD